MDLERYRELKKQVDNAQRDSDKAEGALSQIMERLEEEHGCKTLTAAKAKLKKLDKEVLKAEKEFDTALEQFEEDWEEQLEDDSDD